MSMTKRAGSGHRHAPRRGTVDWADECTLNGLLMAKKHGLLGGNVAA